MGIERFFKIFKTLISSLKDRIEDVKLPQDRLQLQRREQILKDNKELAQLV